MMTILKFFMEKMNSLLYLALTYFRQKLFLPCHISCEVTNYSVMKTYINEQMLLEEKKKKKDSLVDLHSEVN